MPFNGSCYRQPFIKPTQNLSKIKPNLLSIVEVNDFEMPGAITIPTKVIYKLGDKRYVYVVGQNEEGQAIAEKREIVIERSFITNTIVGIQSIGQYRKKKYNNTVAEDILKSLNVKLRLG